MTGLLLIAHGSPNSEWNRPVLDFGRRVAEAVSVIGRFHAVRTAMLESAQADVAAAVAELEDAGCTRLVAVPLFVTPSRHTLFDVPAALGIYFSAKTATAFADKQLEAARPRVPIVLAPTLAESDVLEHYALDQVRKLSRSGEEEALVILFHGDREHSLLHEHLMRRVTTHCCGEARIRYGDWAAIGVGQEYQAHGVPAIRRALEHKNRVLVVGLYLSSCAATIHARYAAAKYQRNAAALFEGRDVVFSNDAVIDHPRLLHWVVHVATSAAAQWTEASSRDQ